MSRTLKAEFRGLALDNLQYPDGGTTRLGRVRRVLVYAYPSARRAFVDSATPRLVWVEGTADTGPTWSRVDETSEQPVWLRRLITRAVQQFRDPGQDAGDARFLVLALVASLALWALVLGAVAAWLGPWAAVGFATAAGVSAMAVAFYVGRSVGRDESEYNLGDWPADLVVREDGDRG